MFTSGDTVMQSPHHQPPGKLEVPFVAKTIFCTSSNSVTGFWLLSVKAGLNLRLGSPLATWGFSVSYAETGKFDC